MEISNKTNMKYFIFFLNNLTRTSANRQPLTANRIALINKLNRLPRCSRELQFMQFFRSRIMNLGSYPQFGLQIGTDSVIGLYRIFDRQEVQQYFIRADFIGKNFGNKIGNVFHTRE